MSNYHKKKLYIKNLDFGVVPEDIRDVFEEFGNIIACDVPRD
jgi:RNA recognition motif-containing protein